MPSVGGRCPAGICSSTAAFALFHPIFASAPSHAHRKRTHSYSRELPFSCLARLLHASSCEAEVAVRGVILSSLESAYVKQLWTLPGAQQRSATRYRLLATPPREPPHIIQRTSIAHRVEVPSPRFPFTTAMPLLKAMYLGAVAPQTSISLCARRLFHTQHSAASALSSQGEAQTCARHQPTTLPVPCVPGAVRWQGYCSLHPPPPDPLLSCAASLFVTDLHLKWVIKGVFPASRTAQAASFTQQICIQMFLTRLEGNG